MYVQDPDLLWVLKDYQERLARRRARRPQVVLMGDSCTEFSQCDLWLAKLFREAAPAREIQLLNLGVAGWTTYQGLKQLRRDLVPLRPEVVLIRYGWNDHWIAFGIEDKQIGEINRSLLYKLRGVRLVQLLTKARVGSMAGRAGGSPKRVSEADFRANLEAMVDLARERDIIPVLVTAPSAHVAGSEPEYLKERFIENLADLIPLHRRYVEIVRDVAREKQAVLCDLAARFDALPSEEVRAQFFRDDGIHTTTAGDQKVAEFYYECLKENDLMGKIVGGEDQGSVTETETMNGAQ